MFTIEQQKALEESVKRQIKAYKLYLKFAEKAKEEGFEGIAILFETTAHAEKIHAKKYYKLLHGKELTDEEIEEIASKMDYNVKDTISNLEEAIKAENYENTKLYPKYAELFRNSNPGGYILYIQTAKVEGVHRDNYKKALEYAKKGKDLPIDAAYLCPVCGSVAVGKRPYRCSICAELGKNFLEFKRK